MRQIESYVEVGNGPVVILLHGYTEDHWIWTDTIQTLKNDFRIIAPDLPGHGANPELDSFMTIEDFAGSILHLLNQLKIERFAIVGHSMGGYIALEIAKARPEYCSSLSLINSTAYEDSPEKKRTRQKVIDYIEKVGMEKYLSSFVPDLFADKTNPTFKPIIDEIIRRGLQLSSQSAIIALNAMKNRQSSLPFLETTSIPISFIVGKKDISVPFQEQKEQFLLPKHVQTMALENIGHMALFEAKEITIKHLHSFLASR